VSSFPSGSLALVIGAQGGIGQALLEHAQSHGDFTEVMGLGRHSTPAIDLLSEASIAESAAQISRHLQEHPLALRAVFVATGFLHGQGWQPEKTWQHLDPAHMAHSFAINAIGPALLLKHFLPLLPTQGKSVFALLSAKVGSISDNQLGGWTTYRAAKAALNQIVRTASIELRRRNPHAVCVALHPGTVDTRLSTPFAKTGLNVQTPQAAASALWSTVNQLDSTASGQFFNQHGEPLPW
jgi:NAD(P)-dependent dehydrogenase (short-subunit alcohol dehydrogenase family)